MEVFNEIQKKLGFGMMRLPMKDEEVDVDETCKMVDYFIENGFNYFDTAHGYLNGKSEKAVKTCLSSRHRRDEYILTDKLTGSFFQTNEDIRPLFEEQLENAGVDYFDFYLMHAQNAREFEKFKRCKAYETAFALKKEGKIKHFYAPLALGRKPTGRAGAASGFKTRLQHYPQAGRLGHQPRKPNSPRRNGLHTSTRRHDTFASKVRIYDKTKF